MIMSEKIKTLYFRISKKVEKEEFQDYEDALIKLTMLKHANINEIEKLTF